MPPADNICYRRGHDDPLAWEVAGNVFPQVAPVKDVGFRVTVSYMGKTRPPHGEGPTIDEENFVFVHNYAKFFFINASSRSDWILMALDSANCFCALDMAPFFVSRSEFLSQYCFAVGMSKHGTPYSRFGCVTRT